MNTVILAILLNQLWDGTGRVIPNAIVIGLFAGSDIKNVAALPTIDAARRAHRLGVKLAMGKTLAKLEWFVKAGLTPVEALHTARTNAAAMLGQQPK
jgi:hypothetical protein